MRKEDQIYKNICETAGIVDGMLNGVRVYFTVKEMYDRNSGYRPQPSGRYQINVSSFGSRRDTIFRTKVKDGSFDILGVIDAVKTQARVRQAEAEREATINMNRDAAEALREKYKFKSRFVSAYTGSAGSFCAPSSVEGKINVQMNFGAVDPEVAEKIFAFVQSLEA